MRTKIPTRSGGYFDLANPMPADVRLSDIIVPLANMPRFNSQSIEMLSVAVHSLALAMSVPKELKAAALLHDSAEAYIGDITTPVKSLLSAEISMRLQTVELLILEAIESALGVPFVDKMADLKKWDQEICQIEQEYLYGSARSLSGCSLFEPSIVLNRIKRLQALSSHEVALEFITELFSLAPMSQSLHSHLMLVVEGERQLAAQSLQRGRVSA